LAKSSLGADSTREGLKGSGACERLATGQKRYQPVLFKAMPLRMQLAGACSSRARGVQQDAAASNRLDCTLQIMHAVGAAGLVLEA
jgi:hypothetical protein